MVKMISYIDAMKTLSILCLFLILANCSAHSVKVGKLCTTPTADGSFKNHLYGYFIKQLSKLLIKK